MSRRILSSLTVAALAIIGWAALILTGTIVAAVIGAIQ